MSMFSHRHYAVLASLIAGTETHDDLYVAIVATLRRDNPGFDVERFLNAARGTPSGKDRRDFDAPMFQDHMAVASRTKRDSEW